VSNRESYSSTTIINNKEDTPLFTNTDTKTRWKEYFQELYNPNALTKYSYNPIYTKIQEPEMPTQEIATTITNSPCKKSPRVDDLPNEAIKACKEIGVKWLKRIFTAAWTERKVPDDWQTSVIVPL
jgi:hypothetical protein